MGWWKVLEEQLAEFWQQLLYRLELTTAGADDLPWLDALKFFWDSLPDADKLTTAERRRLAHSVKLLVKQSVQAHYDKQVSQKQAIHLRQLLRQQAQAEQHIQQLADKRQAEMQALSDTARQQSQVLPAVTDVEGLLADLGGLLPGGIQQDELQDVQQQCQYLQQWQNSRSNSRRQSKDCSRQQGGAALQMAASLSASTAAAAAVVVAGADHTVISIHDQLDAEIQPASDCSSSSSSSSRSSSPRRHRYRYRPSAAAVASDLQQPLLAAADGLTGGQEQHLHHDVLDLYQQQQQQRGYVAPAVVQRQEQQQGDNFHQRQQQQDQDVVIDIRPLNSKSVVQTGSQLLLHRYLNGSQYAAAAMQARSEAATPAAAKVQQDSQTDPDVQRILHTAASDISSDGLDALDVRTPTYSSGSGDQCSVGPLAPRSSVSSSTVAGSNCVSQAPKGVERIDSGCSTDTGDQGLQKGRGRGSEFVGLSGDHLRT